MTTESTDAETAPDGKKTRVRLSAHFRGDDGSHMEQAVMTLGNPALPYVLFTFAVDREDDAITNIFLDVTGLNPEATARFLREMANQMERGPAEEIRPDGTRVPYQSFTADKPTAAENEKSTTKE